MLRRQNKPLKRVPLLAVLVTSFVTLTVLSTGLVGFFSFRNGHRAVNDVARRLRNEVTARIQEHLAAFFDTPHRINLANAKMMRAGILDADDPAVLERHFWEQIQIFDSVSSVYFGNTKGGVVDAGRDGPGGFPYVIATDGFANGRFRKYATNDRGERTDLLLSVPDFDARTRPWYVEAVVAGDAVWSDIYILFTGQDMAIAASRPVYDERGGLLGVVSVDLFLSRLSGFLKDLEVGETGRSFIVERSGLLVASSGEERLFAGSGEDSVRRRLSAADSADPLIRHAAKALTARFGDYRRITETRHVEFKIAGRRQHLQVSPLGIEDGPDWLTVVVIPESDFMSRIEANNRVTLLLVIATLLGAVVLGVFNNLRIVGPISRLGALADALSKGEWGRAVGHDESRIREINALTGSLNHMAGQIRRTVADLTTEIAERRQAEAALRKSEERLRTTLNSIGDAVISADPHGKVMGMNPVAETLTGWKETEAVGRPLTEVFRIVNEYTREPVKNPVEMILESGAVVGLANHTVLIARDGAEYQIADSGAPIKDATAKVIGVVLVFRDVTEKLRVERELLKATKLESVGVLAGGIAHDFNNLLTGLFGSIEMAKMFLSPDHKSYEFLESAGSSMVNAISLTKQLLTFAEGSEPIREIIPIGEVVTETARFSLRGSNVTLRADIAPDLWPVEADRGQLSQVAANLVINAQQAMPDGGTITVVAENVTTSRGRFVRITVQDEGVGIAAQHLDRIFDPYFSTKKQGSGLGLAIVHSIISKHDGTVTANSQPNRGTIVTIDLPAAESEESPVVETSVSETSSGLAVSPARVLVMDDEDAVRKVIEAMLERLGCEVTCTVDGREAIAEYRRCYEKGTPYDIVITDLTVRGGMGGEETAREILKVDPRAKIVVSSGYATDPVMANYGEYGFKGIVEKPYRFAELRRVLRKVLET